jgi:membrane fusion protein, multidrug efflux system
VTRLVCIAAAVLAVSCGGSTAAPPSGAARGGRGPVGPVPVEVIAARTDTVIDAITATGQIEPIQSIQLRPEVDGRLVEILVREGAEVEKGTPLFKVDDGELKAQVARAQADRDLAEQALTRTKQLQIEKAAAPADVERAEAQMRSTQAALDLLQLRLDRTLVRAPFAGVAGQRLASLGDYVNNSTRLITLQTVNPQRASFQVPERYADQLKEGQKVLFRVAALPGRDFIGTVDFVDPLVQLPGRTITVKALAPNPRRELQAGMFLEARLETAVRPRATVIPEDAVSPSQGANFVWVVQAGKAERRQVVLGVRTPGSVEVRQGIEPGDQVVVGGTDRLTPGAEVSLTVVDRAPRGTAGDTASRAAKASDSPRKPK